MITAHRPNPALKIFFLLSITAFFLAGCVQRTITVTSTPSQALVYLNDQEVGRTPVTVPFTFYGTYDVRLEREGFAPLWTTRKADAPWWEAPGPDLIAEAIPGAESKIAWHFQLAPAASTDEAALIDRGRELRRSVLTPILPPPPTYR